MYSSYCTMYVCVALVCMYSSYCTMCVCSTGMYSVCTPLTALCVCSTGMYVLLLLHYVCVCSTGMYVLLLLHYVCVCSTGMYVLLLLHYVCVCSTGMYSMGHKKVPVFRNTLPCNGNFAFRVRFRSVLQFSVFLLLCQHFKSTAQRTG